MNKPRQIWLLFGLSLVVVLIALGRVTMAALHLDDVQRRADAEAGVEERVRLALWRMDSALALLVAEEDARPVESYAPFQVVRRALLHESDGWAAREVLVPSPLLGFISSNVWLHFQFGADGRLSSPQVPEDALQRFAPADPASIALREDAAQRLARLQRLLELQAPNAPADPSLEIGGLSSTGAPPSTSNSLQAQRRGPWINRDAVLHEATAAMSDPVPADASRAPPLSEGSRRGNKSDASTQGSNTDNELQARYNTFNSLLSNQQRATARPEQTVVGGAPSSNTPPTGLPPTAQVVQVGRLTASWVSDELLLTRRINFADGYRVQGCWLNWPVIRGNLLNSIRDLLPQPDLQVAAMESAADSTRRLVALRGVALELAPGAVETPPLAVWSPARVTLALAWVAVLCAALAVGLLLNGAVSLSERRAAFVSAVTHELRTPLTTFKMYSEMLADEMVTDPAQRRRYLETLCSEADRLGHLVENVLAFARLERGNARNRVEQTPLGRLLERVIPRLAQRAELAGTRLLVTIPPTAAEVMVHVDPSAVEQILFNLVDNACKHGAAARVGAVPIELAALPATASHASVLVRDHGPGVPPEVVARLFQPFCRSADEAARSAPGVGLGLALSRRLARSMGGDLKCDAGIGDGAGFELTLPRSPRGGGPTLA